MIRWIIITYLCVLTSGAATYYVKTNGNDGLDGSSIANAWLTINHAASVLNAGDIVTVQPGVYNESVTAPANNGTGGSPITFAGVRGSDGSWLSIIEPGVLVTNGWVAATEIGSGVWKQSSWPVRIGEMTLGHKRLAFVYTMGTMPQIASVYVGSGLTAGSNLLTLATNVTMTTTDNNNQLPSWDGVEALWGTVSNQNLGTWSVYLRLRGGSSPDGLEARLIPNNSVAFNLNTKSYVTVSNFMFRDFDLGVYLAYNGGACNDNTLASNYFYGGSQPIAAQTGCNSNTISRNVFNGAYYGYAVSGAWDAGAAVKAYDYIVKGLIYPFSKFIMGITDSDYCGIALTLGCGNGNSVICNVITNGIGIAIQSLNEATQNATNTVIADNYISGMSSVGITVGPGNVGLYIRSNHIADCNSGIRFHDLNWQNNGIYDSNRLVYVYRNTGWLPSGVGNHVFTYSADSGVSNQQSVVWYYQNSVSGGYGATCDNGNAKLNGGLNKFYFINNVMSDTEYANPITGAGIAFWTNTYMVGLFDYNLTTPPVPFDPSFSTHNYPAWFGVHCITNATAVWANTAGMSFALPSGSAAIDSGLDIPTTYPALPFTGTKLGPSWDMGAFEWQPGVANIGTATFY